MKFFDLDLRKECSEQNYYWANLDESGTLWKLGSLPPRSECLIIFYSITKPLDTLQEASMWRRVQHIIWLDIGMNQLQRLWKSVYFNAILNHCRWIMTLIARSSRETKESHTYNRAGTNFFVWAML